MVRKKQVPQPLEAELEGQDEDPAAKEEVRAYAAEKLLEHAKIDKLREAQQNTHEQKMLGLQKEIMEAEKGWLGILFGYGGEKAGNIAGVVLVMLSILICIAFFYLLINGDKSQIRVIITSVVSVFTLILGYLFGSNK